MTNCPTKKVNKILNEQYSFSTTDNKVTKIHISPDEFLKTTWKQYLIRCHRDDGVKTKEKCESFREYKKSAIFPPNVEGIREVIKGKKKSSYGIPIPFLEFNKRGKPTGHEGRHTALAIKSLGCKSMPVTLVKRK